MGSIENALVITLFAVNLVSGFGCALPIARLFGRVDGRGKRTPRFLGILIAIYFIECVAFAVGMATQVFTVGLALVWGFALGLWLRRRGLRGTVASRTSFLLALYTCLPTVSFCFLIPIAWSLGGGNVLSASEGINFGMPAFLPWPLNSVLGFCGALLIGTVVLKVLITVGTAGWVIRRGESSLAKASNA